MLYGLWNMGSVLFGLAAWILPVINFFKRNDPNHRHRSLFAVASVMSCAVALYMQIIYSDELAGKSDWTALADTSGTVVLISSVLLTVTLILNAVTFLFYYKNNRADRH